MSFILPPHAFVFFLRILPPGRIVWARESVICNPFSFPAQHPKRLFVCSLAATRAWGSDALMRSGRRAWRGIRGRQAEADPFASRPQTLTVGCRDEVVLVANGVTTAPSGTQDTTGSLSFPPTPINRPSNE